MTSVRETISAKGNSGGILVSSGGDRTKYVTDDTFSKNLATLTEPTINRQDLLQVPLKSIYDHLFLKKIITRAASRSGDEPQSAFALGTRRPDPPGDETHLTWRFTNGLQIEWKKRIDEPVEQHSPAIKVSVQEENTLAKLVQGLEEEGYEVLTKEEGTEKTEDHVEKSKKSWWR